LRSSLPVNGRGLAKPLPWTGQLVEKELTFRRLAYQFYGAVDDAIEGSGFIASLENDVFMLKRLNATKLCQFLFGGLREISK
jgi:hypothetical protein